MPRRKGLVALGICDPQGGAVTYPWLRKGFGIINHCLFPFGYECERESLRGQFVVKFIITMVMDFLLVRVSFN